MNEAASSGRQQHHYRPTAAIACWRGCERDDIGTQAQQMVHQGFQHRPRIAGAQPLAVHDTHAASAFVPRLREEFAQYRFGLRLGEPVQIDFVLHRVLAAFQLAQQTRRIAIAQVFEHIARPERRGGEGFETGLMQGVRLIALA